MICFFWFQGYTCLVIIYFFSKKTDGEKDRFDYYVCIHYRNMLLFDSMNLTFYYFMPR